MFEFLLSSTPAGRIRREHVPHEQRCPAHGRVSFVWRPDISAGTPQHGCILAILPPTDCLEQAVDVAAADPAPTALCPFFVAGDPGNDTSRAGPGP